MNLQHRLSIGRAFSQACDYDRHARVQRRVADGLADAIAALDLPAAPRVLEIGCGTGFLTEAMAARGIGGAWWVTDLSPAMVARCRERLGERPVWHYAALDGEFGTPPDGPPFDLVCASMVVQWFDDLPAAIARMRTWLAPGGWLALTVLTAETFAEWRAAHTAEGEASGTLTLPTMAELEAMGSMSLDMARHVEPFASASDFLASLRAIGAGTAAAGHRPLSPGTMRRVMRRFEQAGCRATYDVATCLFQAAP